MHKMSYSPFPGDSRKLTAQPINTSLPQNMQFLIKRDWANEFERTFVELKNCLNMKEFTKYEK